MFITFTLSMVQAGLILLKITNLIACSWFDIFIPALIYLCIIVFGAGIKATNNKKEIERNKKAIETIKNYNTDDLK